MITSILVYFLVGLNEGAGPFFTHFFVQFLSLWVAEGFMILLAMLIPIFLVAVAAGAFTFGAFMCVTGFFIKIELVGDGSVCVILMMSAWIGSTARAA